MQQLDVAACEVESRPSDVRASWIFTFQRMAEGNRQVGLESSAADQLGDDVDADDGLVGWWVGGWMDMQLKD